MEHVVCNLCKSDNAGLLFTAEDLNYRQGGCFQIVKCRNCGLVYLDPRPGKEELPRWYPDDYYIDASQGRGPGTWAAVHGQILKYRSSGSILDIGCKRGEFLAGLKASGWEAYGVEISPLAAQYAREQHGLQVTTADFAETHFQHEEFDVVTLWQTLEHLRDPLETLREINRILKADGLLAISVPNIDSYQARIFKAKWFHLDAPRHLYQFSPRTIGGLLKNTGFDLQAVNHSCRRHNYVGLRMSLLYALQSHGRRPLTAESRPVADKCGFLKFFFNGCCKLASCLENISGHGGTIEVFAKKRKQFG